MSSSENTHLSIIPTESSTKSTIKSRMHRKSLLKPENKPPRRDSSTVYCSEHTSLFPYERRDDPITKGGHTHKVIFIDELVETDFAEVLDNKRPSGVFQL